MRKLDLDFCYVIWFDNKEDAHFFLRRISMARPAWLLSRHQIAEWAVFWDIGEHP